MKDISSCQDKVLEFARWIDVNFPADPQYFSQTKQLEHVIFWNCVALSPSPTPIWVAPEGLLCHGACKWSVCHQTLAAWIPGRFRLWWLLRAGGSRVPYAVDCCWRAWPLGFLSDTTRFEVDRTGQHQKILLLIRFRSNSDKLVGVERVAIMVPDPQMLESDYVPAPALHSPSPSFRFFSFSVNLLDVSYC